jgi:hypothetical protein
MLRDRISKTHRGDHFIGRERKNHLGHMIRLWADGDDVHWVDFSIVTVVDRGALREPLYPPRGGYDGVTTVASIDLAEELCAGFVKWDGCTQFGFQDHIHIDRRSELDEMFEAVQEARRLAAGLMAPTDMNMIASEYEDH